MQIVIDIPEHIYDAIKKAQEMVSGQRSGKTLLQILVNSIENGTPLPKGHGDLIDRSKLVPDCEEQEIHDGEDWRNEYCGVSCMQIEEYAEVIVKADGGMVNESDY